MRLWEISLLMGFAAGWLALWHRQRADRRFRALSIAPQGNLFAENPWAFEVLPRELWNNLVPDEIASLWILGEIRPEEMPGCAADLLERGYDGTTLRVCAGLIKPVRADIEEFADTLFRELGVVPPDETEARHRIAILIVRAVVAGQMPPFGGVTRVACLYDWSMEEEPAFASIIAMSYRDEEAYGTAARAAALDAEIASACAAILDGSSVE